MKLVTKCLNQIPKALLLSGFLLLTVTTEVRAQEMVWQKIWPNVKGWFDCMARGDSGFFYAAGSMKVIRNFNQPAQFRDTLEGIILTKLTPEGDTVWFKKVCDDVYQGTANNIVFMDVDQNGLLHIGLQWFAWPIGNEYRIYTVFQSTGFSFLSAHIPFYTTSSLIGMSSDFSGHHYLYGQRETSSGSGSYEMFCIKVNSQGEEVYDKGFSPSNHPNCTAQYAEPMPGGKLRLSGNKGKTIVALELDSAGNELAYKQFIDNPFGFVQQDGAFVQQAERGYFFVSNNSWDGTSGSTTQSYVSKVDSLGNVVWSETKTGRSSRAVPTLSGGYFIAGLHAGVISFMSFDPLNQLNWTVPTSTTSIPGGKSISKLLFLNDNSGILYGRNVFNGNINPFAMKVSNVGYPVDPSNPQPPVLATREKLISIGWGRAFPNPTVGKFQIAGDGTLRLMSLQGQVLLEQKYAAGQVLDLSAYPSGHYLYQIRSERGNVSGRIVKE